MTAHICIGCNGAIHLAVSTLPERWAMGLVYSNSVRGDDFCRRCLGSSGSLVFLDAKRLADSMLKMLRDTERPE